MPPETKKAPVTGAEVLKQHIHREPIEVPNPGETIDVEPAEINSRIKHHVIGGNQQPRQKVDAVPMNLTGPEVKFEKYGAAGFVELCDLSDGSVTKRLFGLEVKGLGVLVHVSTRTRQRGAGMEIQEPTVWIPGAAIKDGELVKA